MTRILVTGGAGFIGSHVCDELIKRGDEVVCIDSFNDYYNPRIKEQNIKQLLSNKAFHLFRTDILDANGMSDIFDKHKIEKIIHLAARAGVRPSINNPHLYQEVNIKGTLNLLELAKEHKIKNFVFASSSSVYGGNTKVPFSENDLVDRPVSPYAATKKAGELLCHVYHHLYGLNVSCLRFFTVYGPRGRPDMAPYKFIKWVIEGKPIVRFGDGRTKRDYTYIADIVQGVISALDKNFGFEIFNLGNSEPIELNDFISLIEKITGQNAKINELPVQLGDVDMTHADITKAKKLLDYNPTTRIEEGMEQFYDWYTEMKSNSNPYNKQY
ncbi:MAG: SDR family NAD(P)-dependent oxidoreductase [Nanoarchaeota archaeon]|nr:SDR family NAD(P)-dependent oxidoreductase [Nanoarchaeota archaeon]